MSRPPESEVIRKFRERVAQGDQIEDIKVVYQIAGGMPSERIEEELILLGSGKTDARGQDVLRSIPVREASTELDQAETRNLFQEIGQGIESLVPRSEAGFLPDSLVGSITIEVDGEETTLYFLADEEDRQAQEKPIAPQMAEAIQHFREVSQRLLRKEEDNE